MDNGVRAIVAPTHPKTVPATTLRKQCLIHYHLKREGPTTPHHPRITPKDYSWEIIPAILQSTTSTLPKVHRRREPHDHRHDTKNIPGGTTVLRPLRRPNAARRADNKARNPVRLQPGHSSTVPYHGAQCRPHHPPERPCCLPNRPGDFHHPLRIRQGNPATQLGNQGHERGLHPLRDAPEFFLRAVRTNENARNFLSTFITKIELHPDRAVVHFFHAASPRQPYGRSKQTGIPLAKQHRHLNDAPNRTCSAGSTTSRTSRRPAADAPDSPQSPSYLSVRPKCL